MKKGTVFLFGLLIGTSLLEKLVVPISANAQSQNLTERYCGSKDSAEERFIKNINVQDGVFDSKPVKLSQSVWRYGTCIYILDSAGDKKKISYFLNLYNPQTRTISQEFNNQPVTKINSGAKGFTFQEVNGKVHELVLSPVATTTSTELKGCLNSITLNSGTSKLLVLYNQDGSAINVRENATVKSSILYVAPSGSHSVSAIKQVAGDDGYCWLEVVVPKFERSNDRLIKNGEYIKGWVRGDLVTVPFSKY